MAVGHFPFLSFGALRIAWSRLVARGPSLFKGNTLGSCQKREEREEWWRTAWEGGRLLPPKGNPPPPHLPRPFRRQTLSSPLLVPLAPAFLSPPPHLLCVCVARSRLFSFPFACSRCACSEAASPTIGGQAEGEHAGGRSSLRLLWTSHFPR